MQEYLTGVREPAPMHALIRDMDKLDLESIALYFASGIVCFTILAFVGLMRRATTRWEMEQRLREDDDIHDWLVIFDWTKKILHVPTVLCAFLAAFVVWLFPESGKVVGAIWFCIWLFCHTIEDNNIGRC